MVCDALEHRLGGPSGEGQQQDPFRRDAVHDQASDPMGERERLAGAGPGDDQQGRAAVLDRLAAGRRSARRRSSAATWRTSDLEDVFFMRMALWGSVSRGSGSGQTQGVHTRTGLLKNLIRVGRVGRERKRWNERCRMTTNSNNGGSSGLLTADGGSSGIPEDFRALPVSCSDTADTRNLTVDNLRPSRRAAARPPRDRRRSGRHGLRGARRAERAGTGPRPRARGGRGPVAE